MVAGIGFAVLFYTVGNARGLAIFSVAFFSLGFLMFSDYTMKTKIILVTCLFIFFPIYVTIGNTTRELLGGVGYKEGFAYRLKILGQWKSVAKKKSAMAFTFGRLFFTGGHAIISQTPSEHPYRHFRPYPFIKESLESLLPGALVYNPYYRGTGILLNYNFNIVPGKTSVEVSMIGSLWSMGGWLPVIFGGIAMGFIHGVLIKLVQRSWRTSEMKAYIYISIFSGFFCSLGGGGFS